jgi:hypothetical protein
MIQSKQAAELAPVAVVLTAGVETVNIYDIDLSGGVDVSEEMIEAALLPANAICTGITAIGANTGAITADIGILSGEWRDNDDTRTMATVLMNDVNLNNASAEGAVDTLTDVAMSDTNRSIGIAFSADIAAGANKSVKLIVRTIMG